MNLPEGVGWYELLTETAEELVARGLPADAVVSLRKAHTGASKKWSTRWACTVGCWGRVQPVADIAELIDLEECEVRVKAKSLGVKYATVDTSRTQPEVALRAYVGRDSSPTQVRKALGILEVERIQYCVRVQQLLDIHAIDVEDLLEVDVDLYETLWVEAELQLDSKPYAPKRRSADDLRKMLDAIDDSSSS